jgi:WD40 repeat protein
MAFRADSQYVITGGEDCSCKVWELSSGKLTQVNEKQQQERTGNQQSINSHVYSRFLSNMNNR